MKKVLTFLLILVSCVDAALGARSFNGSSDNLQAGSVDLSGANQVTIVFWLYWNSFANDDDLAMEFTANSNTNNGFFIDPNGAGGNVQLLMNISGGSLLTYGAFTRPSAAAWHHWAVIFDGSGTPDTITAYIDGSSQSFSYTNQRSDSGNFANSNLNFMCRNAASLFAAGRMAEVAVYPGMALSQSEISSLAAGFSPLLVRPTARPYYWPLIGQSSPELELFYGRTATVTGASFIEHPRMLYPFNN